MPQWGDLGWYAAVAQWTERTAWLRGPVLYLTRYGIVLLVAAALVVLWRERHGLAGAVWIPLAMLIAPGIGLVVKNAVAEPRPCRVLPDVRTVVPCDTPMNYSFPSNHSAICAAFAVSLFLLYPRWGLAAAVYALLIGASRVMVGVHYPHDVIAGLLIGGLVGWFGIIARTWLSAAFRLVRAKRRAGAG
jgi:membrane-associated phospholipid phosphatase